MELQNFCPNTITEIKLSYINPVKPSLRHEIKDHKTTYDIFLQAWDKSLLELQEQFKVMLLSASNRLLDVYHTASRGTGATLVDIKLIFACALKANARKIILCHNHPGGMLKPSKDDIALTERCRLSGRLLGIDVADHLIITCEGYYSFSDEGLL